MQRLYSGSGPECREHDQVEQAGLEAASGGHLRPFGRGIKV